MDDNVTLEIIKKELEMQKISISELKEQMRNLMEIKEMLQKLNGQIQGAKWAFYIMVAIGTVFLTFTFGLFDHLAKR
jgi:hypothetical protein